MDKPSEMDSPHWAEKPFQRQLLYSRTSKAYRTEHQDNKEQTYNEEQRPISWWFPLNDDQQRTNTPNTNSYTFGSVDDGQTGVSSIDRAQQETGRSGSVNIKGAEHSLSRSRVSFSSMDDVKVFFPELPEIRRHSDNHKPKRLNIEDNILRIGDTVMYRGRLEKRVDVLSRITDVSSRSSLSSPVITPRTPDITHSIDLEVNKKDPLPSLKRVPQRLKQMSNEVERQTITPVCHGQTGTASCRVDFERERIEQLLSKKQYKNSIKGRKTKINNSNAEHGTKLPAIRQCNVGARGQETVCGQGEHSSSRINLPYLPRPPTCPRKCPTNSRRKH